MTRMITALMMVLMIVSAGACSRTDDGGGGGAAGDTTSVRQGEAAPAATPQAPPLTEDEALTRCRAAAAELGSRLKSALKAAMQDGGPVAAIAVCNEKAPEIAAGIRERDGIDAGRTSLKWRNPDNAPDAWEKGILVKFEAEKAAGASNLDLETWTVVSGDDGARTFRYMKAIPTLPLCLKCHGGNVDPEVAAKIGALYPEDHATGFGLGDLRGAFTVSLPLSARTERD